jgi:hypothetical protein
MIVLAPAVLAAGSTTSPPASTTPQPETHVDPKPATDDERAMRAELKDLARAWADGGGTFGYPFWEKARQRFALRQITASMYREYVTGYRDRLVLGCDLLDQVDTSTDISTNVRELAIEACGDRVDALRAMQRSLDEQVRRAGQDPELDVAASDKRIDELDTEALEALQSSFRSTRLAMDVAQSNLDAVGLQRLSEDAFI